MVFELGQLVWSWLPQNTVLLILVYGSLQNRVSSLFPQLEQIPPANKLCEPRDPNSYLLILKDQWAIKVKNNNLKMSPWRKEIIQKQDNFKNIYIINIFRVCNLSPNLGQFWKWYGEVLLFMPGQQVETMTMPDKPGYRITVMNWMLKS